MPQAGSPIVKSLAARGSGLMQRTMLWISTRGVKYWPAPFLPSAGRLLQQSLEGGGLDIDVSAPSTRSRRSGR